MIFGFILVLVVQFTQADKYIDFEDIPIERYGHAEAQGDYFDVELMPRSSRSLFSNYGSRNVGKHFPIEYDEYKVGDFEKLFENVPVVNLRKKRNAKFDENVVKELGKPLELDVIEPDNITESNTQNTTDNKETNQEQIKQISTINDFIRFRRSSELDDLNRNAKEENNKSNKAESQGQGLFLFVYNGKYNPIDLIATLRDTLTQKLVANPDGNEDESKESTRDTRGVTREQWIKQPYFVQRNADEFSLSDKEMESSESVRAPRVQFVTHGMVDAPSNGIKYDRERRARNWDDEVPRKKLARDLSSEMDYYHPRYMRNYAPAPASYRYRDDRYYYPEAQYSPREPHSHDRLYDYQERRRLDGNKRQGRIIYYANLPEVTRAPPEPPRRERFDYRPTNRYYDDRYYSPYPYRNDPGTYTGRKNPVRPRYEERSMEKTPYSPEKDQTNGSSREIKKKPERRTYEENDRNQFSQNNSQR